MSYFKSLALFVVCFSVGLSIFFFATERINSAREPAAVSGKVFQISNLTSDEIKNQLLHKLSVTPTIDGEKQIQLTGFSSAICRNYKKIELIFSGEGVAVNGDPSEMKIVAPCEAAQDPSMIKAIAIPVDKILLEKPRNAEFKFLGWGPSYAFSNSADLWPRTWVLKKLSFKNESGEDKVINFDVHFTKNKSADSGQRPIVLEF